MRRGDAFWSARFPDLFREAYVDYADARVRYTTELASQELVSRLHLVAVTPAAEIVGEVRCFAAHVADSCRERPFRPHLPHPRSLWAYAVADVRIVGEPTNPADGETVAEVLELPLAQAVAYLQEDDPVGADVVRHAHALGLVASPASPASRR
ncbi:hypothetical protein [Nocardioides panaciterrulae]|uniref:8-oxo-dGTP diphosphatase n=1 Tax=Nocardioides panaciterrulae TaxID=661492 RepID=A0A7Y9JAC4_9ACTN|nr:hypothetical protein [Nocardioides panaciterrulae]NYD41650.1 8-oxo-dGTP diphosphatase [Nocardioides panaciterrulae]